MKKTLAAVAVLGAFAGSALAADVTLYGVIDTGLTYQNVDGQDSLEMSSGKQYGPRFGFMGSEALGDDLTVSFKLESNFGSDTGALNTSNKLFHREASLSLSGNFGTLSAGRIGSMNQGVGTYGRVGATSAFGTSWGTAAMGSAILGDTVRDNMLTYASPKFAGVQVLAQYSMGNGGTDAVENESSSERYYAIGATYANGPLNLLATVDSVNYRTALASNEFENLDDSLKVTVGGNYDFGAFKLYAGAQYFQNAKATALSNSDVTGYVDGYGLTVSAGIPMPSGVVMAGLGYLDASESDNKVPTADFPADKFDYNRYTASVGYNHFFSKRTGAYAVASYAREEYDDKADANYNDNANVWAVMIGLTHKF